MKTLKSIQAENLSENAFKLIGKDWLLLTAEKDGKVNAMTASWGGMGIMWNKPVAFIFVRPQRYTKEFIDENTKLSISVLDDSYREQLKYLGTVSGRDEPKIQKAGLSVSYEAGVPIFDESKITFICRKLFFQDLNPAGFVDNKIDSAMYPNKDYHTMYICEIENILVATEE